jgi:hypothetical protein
VTASLESRIRQVLPWLVAAALALAGMLRTRHASLWLDEIALARPLRELGLWELLSKPLAHAQAAPKGFLLLEKAASTAFGRHDQVLRAVPWPALLAGVFAFTEVAGALLPPVSVGVALLMFATATPFVYFSVVVQPGAVDVPVTVLLLALD